MARRFGASVAIDPAAVDVVEAIKRRRLLSMVEHARIDLTPLVTHRFTLEQLPEAFDLFSRQSNGVMKVAIHPAVKKQARSALRAPATVEY